MGDERPGEFDLIERHFLPLADRRTSLSFRDDAAVYTPPPGHDLVLTKDALAADVHFFSDDPADRIAQKALRVNLSDLAAKGADPVGYLMALCLPGDWTEDWIALFCNGLAGDQERYGVSLFGGDTIKSAGGLTISITAIGSVPAGQAVKRSTAEVDDILYVTGTLGDAALGLVARGGGYESVAARHRDFLTGRYLLPEPRTAIAPAIQAMASAAMDISDGLLADMGHLCRASGVGADIRADLVPLSSSARAVLDRDEAEFEKIFMGGDDYELLVSVSPAMATDFESRAAQADLCLTRIGRVTKGSEVRILDNSGQPMTFPSSGFTHF